MTGDESPTPTGHGSVSVRRYSALPGRRFLIGLGLAALVWAATRAGFRGGVVNTGGADSFADFWRAAVAPEIGWQFVSLTLTAAAVTLAYAILGTVLSVLLGAVAAFWLSELLCPQTLGRRALRVALQVPRAVHEVIWALLLIQVLGFDPLVPILAIGIPFGAVTAKVFAETVDEADPYPYQQLRTTGASRTGAFIYGVLPTARGEFLSYGFYRFECSIRSAAVLGVVGAGGLGFQLDLSFETLRYREIWTLIAALMLLSGVVEAWSSLLRRRHRLAGKSMWLAVPAIPIAWWWVGLDPSGLWSARTLSLAPELVGDLLPPRLGLGGWTELATASLDTVAMSILAIVMAAGLSLPLAALSARPNRSTARRSLTRRLSRAATRVALLLFRAVPAPIWAFLMVLVLFPGIWPGAVALGVYTLGVLGKLFAEAFEDRDPTAAVATDLLGANKLQSFFYATLPSAMGRLVALGLYRWEVIVRETVVVGVVGAGGIGQLMNEHLTARDFAAVAGAIGALIGIALVIDTVSARIRGGLRPSAL